MRKRFLMILAALLMVTFTLNHPKKQINHNNPMAGGSPIPMPLVNDPLAVSSNIKPREQRGIQYRKWLSKSVKVSSGSSGSGTIVYYDHKTGWAYVQSCGHLWKGDMSVEEGKRAKKTATIITWYHNNKKLNGTRKYNAEVLFHSNHGRPDISLLRFKPDWIPEFFPIAPMDYVIREGPAHSTGCDGGREVAHYSVKIIGNRNGSWKDLVTTNNSPRQGRSGGGLISNDGYFIGICWGTSDYDGSGNGYFTPLRDIHKVMTREGYEWMIGGFVFLAREIPIVDRNNPQRTYDKEYIAIPK